MDFYYLEVVKNAVLLRLGLVVALLMVTGCTTTTEIKPQFPIATQQPLISYALSLQGAPYHYGKETPEEGFDCSGFVKHVYGKYGILLPRRAWDMAAVLPPVSQYEMQSGDLVFFNTNGSTYSHVGLFINSDKFIHAPSQRTGRVLVSSLNNTYWRKHFTGVRRPGMH